MSKLSFRARALDASKPMPIYLAEELPDLPDYSAINRAVPQMPSGMEKEEECEHHLQRAICTGLIIPTPEVCDVQDLEFYERCYPPDYKMPKQHIHMQPLWQEQEAPEYDIDSEDERWLKQQRHPELTELMFEQMMDKLEKSSGQTVVTLHEAKLLLERHDDLVIAVYDYWLNKRLKTQHPLILSVKTESRPGQSSNNPYLAFRRRTEKMQTRKNRKNDESSYEKMLKLRRELARALSLLELVARRERAKRELLRLTAALAERRYRAGDFTEPQPRPAVYSMAPLASFRRDAYSAHAHTHAHAHAHTAYAHAHTPHAPAPPDQPRQRDKRPYKRRKHRHHVPAAAPAHRESAYLSSSSSEGGVRERGERGEGRVRGERGERGERERGARAEAEPVDDGAFAFRRKPGCYYEMPTSTLCGDPLDPDDKDGMYEHEVDERHRFTLTSLGAADERRCVGFARLRRARGGRLALDRVRTPLHTLWPLLPAPPAPAQLREEVELETKAHRTPKEITRDYHSSGKYPWRHAFRKHLAANPELWIKQDQVKCKGEDLDLKVDDLDLKVDVEPMDVDKKVDDKVDVEPMEDKSDISVRLDSGVREGLAEAMRERDWSGCSSDESDSSLHPVEKEFEKFIDEVNKKWLHFRPKTPPSPLLEGDGGEWGAGGGGRVALGARAPLAVELREPGGCFTAEVTLQDLATEYDTGLEADGLLDDFTGLTEGQSDTIPSDTDLKLDKGLEGEQGGQGGSFLSVGGGGRGAAFGCSTVRVRAPQETLYVDAAPEEPPVPPPPKKPALAPAPPAAAAPPAPPAPPQPVAPAAPDPVPASRLIVEEVNEVPQIKLEKKKKDDTIEEVQLAHGVQLKTVQTKHSPLKKHIITSAHRRASQHDAPQIRAVAVPDTLKVRLQNHLLSSQASVVSSGATVVGLVQNGPFTAVSQSVASVAGVAGVAGVSVAAPRRVHLAGVQHKPLQLASPVVVGAVHAPAQNKLKVLHAHPLTHEQRAQLLQARAAGITPLPAVVSLATLDTKATNTAILKAPGSVAQFFEIKGQLGKGPHLVNVVRQPPPKPRVDVNDAKKRVVATFDGNALKGGVGSVGGVGVGVGGGRAHRVSLSLDGRQLVRAALPQAQLLRHQIQLKGRRLEPQPKPTISIAGPTKTASIPSSVVANLLQKNVSLGAPRLQLPPAAAAVPALAFSAAQLKHRRLAVPRPPATPHPPAGEQGGVGGAGAGAGGAGEARRRAPDTPPMEVT